MKLQNYFLRSLSVLILSLGLDTALWADEVFIIPNAFISQRNFQYSVGNGGVSGSIQSLGVGVTGTYQRFYLDIVAEKNLKPSQESTTNLLFTNTVDFDREDLSASFGYSINESLSAFTGYKYGRTTITARHPSPFAGERISLQGQGAFIGAGGGWQVRDWGFLSFSAAYARLSADYDDLVVHRSHGNATGTSLGLKWKAQLTKQWYYDLAILRHDYYYQHFSRIDTNISEQILSFRLGMGYRF